MNNEEMRQLLLAATKVFLILPKTLDKVVDLEMRAKMEAVLEPIVQLKEALERKIGGSR